MFLNLTVLRYLLFLRAFSGFQATSVSADSVSLCHGWGPLPFPAHAGSAAAPAMFTSCWSPRALRQACLIRSAGSSAGHSHCSCSAGSAAGLKFSFSLSGNGLQGCSVMQSVSGRSSVFWHNLIYVTLSLLFLDFLLSLLQVVFPF